MWDARALATGHASLAQKGRTEFDYLTRICVYRDVRKIRGSTESKRRGAKTLIAGDPAQKKTSRDGTKLVGGHFPPEISRQLKVLAAQRDTTCQELLHEALRDLFMKYGRSPFK